MYFTTKGDNRVWALDAATSVLELIYDDSLVVGSAPLTGVDNVVVNRAGEIFVAEDGGDMQIVVIDADRRVEPLLQIAGHPGSEITGPAFDPSGTRLYFSSQRGTSSTAVAGSSVGVGITYEVTGPFHGAGNTTASAGIVSGLVHDVVEPPVRDLDPTLGDAVHTVDRTVAGLGL